MAAAKPACAFLALLTAALALTLMPPPRPPNGPPPREPATELVHGPLTEADVRDWAARSDWSRPPQPAEAAEWRGERWVVLDAGAGWLWLRPDPAGPDDRLAPPEEARALGAERELPSGEVVRYRPLVPRGD
jgi:hypothetical protein